MNLFDDKTQQPIHTTSKAKNKEKEKMNGKKELIKAQ